MAVGGEVFLFGGTYIEEGAYAYLGDMWKLDTGTPSRPFYDAADKNHRGRRVEALPVKSIEDTCHNISKLAWPVSCRESS